MSRKKNKEYYFFLKYLKLDSIKIGIRNIFSQTQHKSSHISSNKIFSEDRSTNGHCFQDMGSKTFNSNNVEILQFNSVYVNFFDYKKIIIFIKVF